MVYGVTFEKLGQIYHLEFDGEIKINQKVVAESDFGIEIGNVVKIFKEETAEKKILRIATYEDIENDLANQKDAKAAFEIGKEKVVEHALPMKMLYARYTLDKTKLIYFFSADGRIDFRALVKDLAATFKTRIELRQIGVRDVAKIVGGIGMCGMQTCCSRFERDFKSITLKYAKTQQLLINPSKISGVCGRLLCCLAYENDNYLEILKGIPDTGDTAKFGDKIYTVSEVNIFSKTIKLRNNEEELKMTFDDFLNGKGEKICDLKPPEETELHDLEN
ncbi:PSP1 domain-containing protein [Athalassotoga saccharophila]|uniref:PSP1 domain-containing protein n=1 Tax=Athalassotoga saccharophila TaxID=1441386 RepID=UPI00137A0162|nr:regulatory iron-sulfur-containing complex subunit RicT [Athalassotoga saccharophila]BBJ28493.1 stage 0 sporulation protein YaaT [Athalassotoga saccharophila]